MSYDKQQATHEFERWSLSYDRSILQFLLFRPSHQAMLKRIAERCGDRPLKVLDVGCGTGVFAARIREAFPKSRVCGVDLVHGMLHQGKARWKALAPFVQPVQGDSERLPFATGAFDILTCANSFHHYPHQDRALQEMHRVLRPGGRIMLIDGYRDAPWGWFIYDVCVAGVEGAVHHCSSSRVRDLMTRAGFGDIHQKVHRGAAPFLFTEAVAKPRPTLVPAPHFTVGTPARQTHEAAAKPRDSAA